DGAERMPKREAMALGLDGDALDRGRDAGSGQRLPTTEGSQAASNVAGRSGSSPQQRLTRCPCSPSHRRLTSISAATASQCSTKRRDTPLARVAEHIDTVQTTLRRQMLLENPSTYVGIAESTIPEVEFLAEVSRRTGCGLLLDINNVFVSCTNLGTSPQDYLDEFPFERVEEIHLGGHYLDIDDAGAPLLIDAHAAPVAQPVWELYACVIAR